MVVAPLVAFRSAMPLGVFGEYLDKQMSSADLTAERKRQLKRISAARGGRDVIVYAADLNKGSALVHMNYSDILPFTDQLANLGGKALDLVLETPGGSGEVAEQIVRILRTKYEDIGVIIPGWAKSAGTMVALAGDEILMGPASALGPIDAQMTWQGKVFSVEALLEGFERIKREVEESGVLNKAYIPILQGISPGELESARNMRDFAQTLVTEWLVKYKFRRWVVHSRSREPVSEEERGARAAEIAAQLCNHSKWKTHGRSIRIDDLKTMGLQIVDYSVVSELADAIGRYYALLQMTFESNVYKLFETPSSQIVRFLVQQVPPPQRDGRAEIAVIDYKCQKCGKESQIQANLGKKHPLQAGLVPFPPDDVFRCPNCGTETNLSSAKRQVEAQARRPVIA